MNYREKLRFPKISIPSTPIKITGTEPPPPDLVGATTAAELDALTTELFVTELLATELFVDDATDEELETGSSGLSAISTTAILGAPNMSPLRGL